MEQDGTASDGIEHRQQSQVVDQHSIQRKLRMDQKKRHLP
jgi:hypothetical protein